MAEGQQPKAGFNENKLNEALKITGKSEDMLREQLRIDAKSVATKSFIASVVSVIYATSVLGVISVCLWGAFFEKTTILEAYEKLADFIKIAVLPIVTLVIGYYSGRSKFDSKRKE